MQQVGFSTPGRKEHLVIGKSKSMYGDSTDRCPYDLNSAGQRRNKRMNEVRKHITPEIRQRVDKEFEQIDKIHKIETFIQGELCERRDYSASKMCEVILEYINSTK